MTENYLIRAILQRARELMQYGLAPLLALATAPLLARGLGPAGRGEYGVALNIATIAVAVCAFGRPEIYLAEKAKGDGHFRREIVIVAVVSAVVGPIAALVAGYAGLSVGVSLAVGLSAPVLALGALARSVALGSGNYGSVARSVAYGAVIRLLVLVALVAFELLSPVVAVIVFQAGTALGMALAFYRPSKERWRIGEDQRRGSLALRGSISLLCMALMTAVLMRADLFFVRDSASAAETGAYAASVSLLTSVLAVSGPFKARIQAGAAQADNRRSRIVKEGLLALLASLTAAVLLFLAAPLVVGVLFGQGYGSAIEVLRIFSIAVVGLVMLDVVQGALAMEGKRVALVIASGVGAVTALTLLSILTPTLGAPGAAWASSISYLLAAVSGWVTLLASDRRGRVDPAANEENR